METKNIYIVYYSNNDSVMGMFDDIKLANEFVIELCIDELNGNDNLNEENRENRENEENEEKEPTTILNQIKESLGVTKKENMSNMEPRPYSEDDLYDVYGQTVGSLDCGAKSAGLSNSKGPLCLNKKQLTMLSTRGGNAKSDAQIGA